MHDIDRYHDVNYRFPPNDKWCFGKIAPQTLLGLALDLHMQQTAVGGNVRCHLVPPANVPT